MAYIGHSRGCENALQTAVARDAHGIVLINPTGLRIHKGINPISRMTTVDSIYKMLPLFLGNAMMLGGEFFFWKFENLILKPFWISVYKAFGFKITTGEEAVNSMRSMINVSLGGQLEFIEKTNDMNVRLIVHYFEASSSQFLGQKTDCFRRKRSPRRGGNCFWDAREAWRIAAFCKFFFWKVALLYNTIIFRTLTKRSQKPRDWKSLIPLRGLNVELRFSSRRTIIFRTNREPAW